MPKKFFILFIGLLPLLLQLGCREKVNLTDPPNGPNVLISDKETPHSLTIYTPKTGDAFLTGVNLEVRWTATASIMRVNLTLYRKEDYMAEIASGTLNDGSYSWKIPNSLPASVHYRVKLSNSANPDEFVFSDSFSISLPEIDR